MGSEEETVKSREWMLSSSIPQGVPTSDHLKIRMVKIDVGVDSIPDSHVAVQILFISVDPYLRAMMTGQEDGLYLNQFQLNQALSAFGVGRIISSKDANYKNGDLVSNPFFPLAEYCVIGSVFLRKIDIKDGISLFDYLSVLGIPGFTAWVGMQVVGDPKAQENVFISAAAGAVGMFAGQLAKLKGCRVVGSTGADEKVFNNKRNRWVSRPPPGMWFERSQRNLQTWQLPYFNLAKKAVY